MGVYLLVGGAVLLVTRLEHTMAVGRYVHLAVAAIFCGASLRLARGQLAHFGISLAGLLEPADDERARGPFGLWDLGRAFWEALPSALRELGVAMGTAFVVFPLYGLGYAAWQEPGRELSLSLPPELFTLALTQFLVVALPEEAFFRGYIQTALSDLETRRLRVAGVSLAPRAWLLQAVLFALLHVAVQPQPTRLAVFFPALLFGWLRAWRGGIGAASAMHALSNLYSETLGRSWL
jgi:membrane protease YdiL (CAAX protease family)